MVERSPDWLTSGHRQVPYRGVIRNDAWLHLRVAAIELRRLLDLGLTDKGGEPPRRVRRLVCPAFRGVALLESWPRNPEGGFVGRHRHPPEFRRKVLDPVAAGRPIVNVARELGISAQAIYTWRRQDRSLGSPGPLPRINGRLRPRRPAA